VYGALAAEHLKNPRNLGKMGDADGVGEVEDRDTDTLVTVYLKLAGDRTVAEARFRAFGCGGCIVTGSIATELAVGRPVGALSGVDAVAINAAIEDGLPAEQRYCAELAARALHLAAAQAAGPTAR
jgi:nitrogen fixation NifU-like protein